METINGKHESDGVAVEANLSVDQLITACGQDSGSSNRALVDALIGSRVYREYERAFSELTGLPLALQPVETWQLPHHGKRNENPFCGLMSQKSSACSVCLQTQEKLCAKTAEGPETLMCPSGLCDIAVPVRLNNRLIGFLQSGQMFRKKPTPAQFERTAKLVEKWGIVVDRETLKKA